MSIALPERLGCFAHTRNGQLLLGFAKSLCLGTLTHMGDDTAHLDFQMLTEVESERLSTRVNDGRCDRSGQLVFGTLNEGRDRQPTGNFYQYSMRHGLRRLNLPSVTIANSICFSLNGRRMYFCDTVTQLIQQCEYDAETAWVGQPRPFAAMADALAWPDGSVVDAQDCLWNAQWGAGQVSRYASDGRLLLTLHMPAPHSTCPALGGADGRRLLVATARQDMGSAELVSMPLSGSLFGTTLAEPLAVPEPLFEI